MSSRRNKHGLSRHIPERVRETVRQRSGYGCVFDGNLVVQYDHFDPEFVECRQHSPNGIALLCPTCHEKKKKNRLTNEMVGEAYLHPYGIRSGFVFTDLDWEADLPLTVQLGELRIENVPIVLKVAGIDVFGMKKPNHMGEPFRLHARVFDLDGEERVHIVDNELKVSLGDVDIVHESNEVDVRASDGESLLRLRLKPPATFEVAAIRMAIKGYGIHLNSDLDLVLTRPDGSFNALGGPGVIRNYQKAAIWFE